MPKGTWPPWNKYQGTEAKQKKHIFVNPFGLNPMTTASVQIIFWLYHNELKISKLTPKCDTSTTQNIFVTDQVFPTLLKHFPRRFWTGRPAHFMYNWVQKVQMEPAARFVNVWEIAFNNSLYIIWKWCVCWCVWAPPKQWLPNFTRHSIV